MAAYNDRSKKKYSKILFSALSILAGAFLLIEHLFAWGDFAFLDFVGHEWLGLALIIIPFIMNLNFKVPLSSEIKWLIGKFKKS